MATDTEQPLHILHVDAERGFSGGEAQVFLLLEGLRKRGHRCVLVCPPRSRCEEEGRARGFEVREVAMRSDVDAAAVLQLVRVLRASGADLVHLHTGRAAWLGALAARVAGVPAIATRRMDRPLSRGLRARLLYGRLLRRTVAISPAVAGHLRRAGVPAARLRTISSAVDPEALVPVSGRCATRAGAGLKDEPLLLAAAALVRRKGIDVLLEALARLGERGLRPSLWIAGEGPERAALQRASGSLGLSGQVRLLGRREDVPDLLAACDVFVLPSRREGLGVAALEAMAARRPVVASRVGGLGEAVADGRTGLLVTPEDPAALADALESLLRDADLRRRLGEAGPARIAEGFLAEQMAGAYEALYCTILSGGPPARREVP